MQGIEYLKELVENIHSTTVATIGADGHPVTRVIDMMLRVNFSILVILKM